MPIQVSLEIVLKVPDTEALLPKELRDLFATIEEKPEERTNWGVLADWFDEASEPGLARACRFVAKRQNVLPQKDTRSTSGKMYRWDWNGLPSSVSALHSRINRSGYSIGGLLAELAEMLRIHDEEAA